MITIHYDFTNGTEVSFAEGKSLGDGFTTNCLDFFQTANDSIVLKKNGDYISSQELLDNDGSYTNKQIRVPHNIQKILKAGGLRFKSNAPHQSERGTKR